MPLPIADFDHNDFDLHTRNKADEKLLVKFYIKPRPDKEATKLHGRPCFKDVEYIDIRIPGSRDGVGRPATDDDKARFPLHYSAFKNRTEEEYLEGTPLSEWSLIGRSQAEELAFFNCKTVEQLAEMDDARCSGFMGIQALKQKAKDWLKRADEDAPAARLKEELEVRDAKIEELEKTLADMSTKIDKLVEASIA